MAPDSSPFFCLPLLRDRTYPTISGLKTSAYLFQEIASDNGCQSPVAANSGYCSIGCAYAGCGRSQRGGRPGEDHAGLS